MPSALKRALAREVSRRQGTMNDVAVSILAERFGVEFEPSGRRGGSTPVRAARCSCACRRL